MNVKGNYKFDRAKAIAEAVMHTAAQVTKAAKQLPRTGKKGRNTLRKTYNRRPQNKRKRAAILARMVIAADMGAFQLLAIASQPMPKLKTGTV